MTKRTLVEFQVTYTPALATQVFDIMSRCDLGIESGEMNQTYHYSWTTSAKVDKHYIGRMENAISSALHAQGITQIHSINHINN